MQISPTAEGFRAAFRRPLVACAEIVWRWSVGVVAGTLAFFGLIEYLDTLAVSPGDSIMLASGQPYLIAAAVARILRGSLSRGMLSALIAAFLLAGLWIIAASIGRYAVVRDLLSYFSARRQSPGVGAEDSQETSTTATTPINSLRTLASLLRLNFLRVTIVLAAVLAIVGSAAFAGAVADHYKESVLGVLLFVPAALLVSAVTWMLNRFVSLAAMIAVREDADAVTAMSSAAWFWRNHSSAVAAVTIWTAMAHLAAFSSAASFAMTPLLLLQLLPWRLVALTVVLILLLYFALADWLAVARLAGYLSITELPRHPIPPPLITPEPEPRTAVDPNELILSDVPLSQPI